MLPASIGTPFRVLVGPVKRGAPNLLIQQGLLSELLRRNGEGSLNLKDLIAMLPRASDQLISDLSGFCRATENVASAIY